MASIPAMSAYADLLDARKVGYDQGDRWSFNPTRDGKSVITNGEGDCSSTCAAILRAGGVPIDTRDPIYTGNFAARAQAAGCSLTNVSDWGRGQIFAALREGDLLLGPGHVVYVRSAGSTPRVWSAESDERGQSSGGQAGDQTGREARMRDMYMRPRGWRHIVRPPAGTDPLTNGPSSEVRFRGVFANVLGRRFDPAGAAGFDKREPELEAIFRAAGASIVGMVECYGTEAEELTPSGWWLERNAEGQALMADASKWMLLGRMRGVHLDTYHGGLAVEVRHRASGRVINLVVVHLSPSKTADSAERKAQLAEVATYAAGWQDPTIVLGDLNDSAAPSWLRSAGYAITSAPSTIRGWSAGPDYIAARGAVVRRLKVLATNGASDHNAISWTAALASSTPNPL